MESSTSGGEDPPPPGLLSAHAMLMTVAWMICVPVGVAFAKRFKVEGRIRDLKIHFVLMAITCAATLLGVGAAYAWRSSQPEDRVTATSTKVHFAVGMLITWLVVIQVAWASRRPSPPSDPMGEEKTTARARWEVAHRAAAVTMFLLTLVVQGITGPLSLAAKGMQTAPP